MVREGLAWVIDLFPLCLVSVVGLYGEGGASLGDWFVSTVSGVCCRIIW